MAEAAISNECVEAEYSFRAEITEEENIEVIEEPQCEEKIEGIIILDKQFRNFFFAETATTTAKEKIKKKSGNTLITLTFKISINLFCSGRNIIRRETS